MQAAAKRGIDIVGAAIGLALSAPVFGLVALATRLDDDGPVFFRQQRIGLGGRPFTVLKFRTMRVDAERVLQQWRQQDAPQWRAYLAGNRKLRHDPRVTRIGRFLRRTSLDELPQLINVLRGEMSLVGPRPLLPDELDCYGHAALADYVRVRPGITGLWQVSGRSDTTFEQRVQLDREYVRNRGFWRDLAILARTLPALLGRRGAY